MNIYRKTLPVSGLIGEEYIKNAIKSRSRWLSRFVKLESIALPICILILLGAVLALEMNVWCLIAIVVAAVPSLLMDTRTLSIPSKWIYNETLIGLVKKLERQKVERKYQTLIELPFAVAWMCWFLYEFIKCLVTKMDGIPERFILPAWWIITGIALIITLVATWKIYKEAQKTNNDMINEIKTFLEDSGDSII
ncbi:MAG: hypothetical protein K2J70_05990 [Muribaculaceae bacterium]|nr:hypothetical protein [Muribaculaceae bacterium]